MTGAMCLLLSGWEKQLVNDGVNGENSYSSMSVVMARKAVIFRPFSLTRFFAEEENWPLTLSFTQ